MKNTILVSIREQLEVVNLSPVPLMAILLISILFSGSVGCAAPIPDWRPTYLEGISDLHGNEIVPAKYRKMEYKGHGVFLGYDFAYRDIDLFGFNGEKLKYNLPPGTIFVNLYWQNSYPKNEKPKDKELLNNLLFAFRRNGGCGLCDKSGKVLLEPKYSKIGFAGEGYLFLLRETKFNRYGYDCWLLDMESFKTIPLSCRVKAVMSPLSAGRAVVRPAKHPQSIGFVDTTGVVKTFKKYISASPFRNGVCTVFVKSKDKKAVRVDKNYKATTSGKFDISNFYAGRAVARFMGLKPQHYGLVDRDFNWTVPPDYTSIEPIYESYGFSRNVSSTPAFYCVKKEKSDSFSIMSLRGEILCSFPEGFLFSSLIYRGNIFTCHSVDAHTGRTKTTVFTMEQDYMKPSVHGIPKLLVKELAPGRLLYRVKRDDGALHKRGGFGNFLEDYDLIGMSVDQVYSMLAPNVKAQHRSDTDLHLHLGGSLGAKLFFRNNKVWKWCFVKGGQEYAPYFQNVVFDYSAGSPYSVPKMKLKSAK